MHWIFHCGSQEGEHHHANELHHERDQEGFAGDGSIIDEQRLQTEPMQQHQVLRCCETALSRIRNEGLLPINNMHHG